MLCDRRADNIFGWQKEETEEMEEGDGEDEIYTGDIFEGIKEN